MARQFSIRDLVTGEILHRHDHSAVEILRQSDRFVEVGQEPEGWTIPTADGGVEADKKSTTDDIPHKDPLPKKRPRKATKSK